MSFPSVSPNPAIRVSDDEREQHVDVLRRHAAEGRLTVDELEERVERAYAARTREELAAVLGDLPLSSGSATQPPQPAAPTRRRLASSDLMPYVGVNLVLVAVWALTGAGYFWPIWPILGWGVGIACHARAGRHALSRRCGSATPPGARAPGA